MKVQFAFCFLMLFSSAIAAPNKPNLKICHGGGSLLDRRGNYLKKVCEVHQDKTYSEAQKFCRQNGMELLVLENKETFIALETYMSGSWIGLTRPDIWDERTGFKINGMRNETDGKWYTLASEMKLLSEDLPWLVDPSHGDACLTIKKNQNFRITGYNCASSYFSFCEYDLAYIDDYNLDFSFESLPSIQ